MKRISIVIKTAYTAMLSFVYSTTVYAEQISIQASFDNPLGTAVGTIPAFIASILKIAVMIGTPIAILAIVYSGFLFLVAQGNQDKLTKAKQALLWALVGTFVLLGAEVFAIAISGTVSQL